MNVLKRAQRSLHEHSQYNYLNVNEYKAIYSVLVSGSGRILKGYGLKQPAVFLGGSLAGAIPQFQSAQPVKYVDENGEIKIAPIRMNPAMSITFMSLYWPG